MRISLGRSKNRLFTLQKRCVFVSLKNASCVSKGDFLFGRVAELDPPWDQDDESTQMFRYQRYTLDVDGVIVHCQGLMPQWCRYPGTRVSGYVTGRGKSQPWVLQMNTLVSQKFDQQHRCGLETPHRFPIHTNDDITGNSDSMKKKRRRSSKVKKTASEFLDSEDYWRNLRRLTLAPSMKARRTLEFLMDENIWQQSISFDTEYDLTSHSECYFHGMYELGISANFSDHSFGRFLKIPGLSFSQRFMKEKQQRLSNTVENSFIAQCVSIDRSNQSELDDEFDRVSLTSDELISQICSFLSDHCHSNGKYHWFHHYGSDAKLLQSLLKDNHHSELSRKIEFVNTSALFQQIFPKKQVESRDLTSLINACLPNDQELDNHQIKLKLRHSAEVDSRCLSVVLSRLRSDILSVHR